MAGGPGREKRLPSKDRSGTYHIDGSLVVAEGLGNYVLPYNNCWRVRCTVIHQLLESTVYCYTPIYRG
jgi:hypothetical protein